MMIGLVENRNAAVNARAKPTLRFFSALVRLAAIIIHPICQVDQWLRKKREIGKKVSAALRSRNRYV
jgi:hypothetical protein